MSVRKGNKIVSGRGKNGTGFALFTPKFFDYVLNNPSWLRADTLSWHSGDVYKSAYEHLVEDLTKSVKLYAWETPEGDVFYTKTSSPAVDDEFYYSNGGYAKAYITVVDTSSGTLTWENERGRTGTVTRKTDLDTSYNVTISSSTETVGSTTINYYRTSDGHKIVMPDQENNVESIYREVGVSWYYILDTTNKLFKLPRTKYSFTGLRDSVGNFVEAGLPNIKGYFDTGAEYYDANQDETPPFSATSVVKRRNEGGKDANQRRITFDASTANPIYGNSDTVQPPSTQMYLYFYVGNTVINQTEVDVGVITELLNGKQDVLGNNVDYVVETFRDGANWYRIYKSGWVEQGGNIPFAATGSWAAGNITFLKPMADTNYYLNGRGNWSDRQSCDLGVNSKTTTGCNVTVAINTLTTENGAWYVCGQGA